MAEPLSAESEYDAIPPRPTRLNVKPPLMRVVSTGFFRTTEQLVSADELLRQDQEERQRKALKQQR